MYTHTHTKLQLPNVDTDPNSRFLLKMRRSQTLVGPHIFLCSVRPANITSLGQRGKLESKIHD